MGAFVRAWPQICVPDTAPWTFIALCSLLLSTFARRGPFAGTPIEQIFPMRNHPSHVVAKNWKVGVCCRLGERFSLLKVAGAAFHLQPKPVGFGPRVAFFGCPCASATAADLFVATEYAVHVHSGLDVNRWRRERWSFIMGHRIKFCRNNASGKEVLYPRTDSRRKHEQRETGL